MSKVGLVTKEEGKFFGSLIVEAINAKGIVNLILKGVLPPALNLADDKFGDKIPEPWQTSIEQLTSMVHSAMGDNNISEEEEAIIVAHCAKVMNDNIDIKFFEENEEAIIYISFWKLAAASLRKFIVSRKK